MNETIQYKICGHYLPRTLRPGIGVLGNVRLKNTGSSVLSSKAAKPVRVEKKVAKVVRLAKHKAHPAKAQRAAPRKQPAARTAHADRPRMAAGGKRKR